MTADVPPVMPLERACEPALLCTVVHETERAGWPSCEHANTTRAGRHSRGSIPRRRDDSQTFRFVWL
jgi:hypothetical protein